MSLVLTDAELLARLVAFDSTSHKSNIPIADFICDYLNRPRIEVVRNYNTDRSKVNVIARLVPDGATERADDPRAGLILSGHMDVVPADEPEWKSNPFTLAETDDAFVGRGACDMKGFVALAVNVMRDAADRTLQEPLVLILTFDEEPGTLGAQHLARTWDDQFPLPASAIIGEPTSLRVVRLHKGHMKIRVTVRGRAAHSGYPHLGQSAIEPMGGIICALTELRKGWARRQSSSSAHFHETPYVALNIGTVHGGSAMNVVPERCVLELGFRPLPGMDSKPLMDEIRQAVLADEAANRIGIEIVGDSPPLLTPESSRVYRTLCGLMGQSDTIGVSYASDAGPLSTMGIECVVWGPGTIEVAHKPNEAMPKADFARARLLLDRAVHSLCGG